MIVPNNRSVSEFKTIMGLTRAPTASWSARLQRGMAGACVGLSDISGIGPQPELLLEGLHRLEYRGYDSAGVAVVNGGEIAIRKKSGRVNLLARLLEEQPVAGTLGIGHTRWATHGETTDVNSHPHSGGNGEVAVVHNGVIENYSSLRESTAATRLCVSHRHRYRGHRPSFGPPSGRANQARAAILADSKLCVRAVELTLKKLKGTYGVAVLFRDFPDLLIVARAGSPLVIGIGDGEYFVASDSSPLVGYTDEVVYLSDHELAILKRDSLELRHRDTGELSPSIQTLDQVSSDVDLGDYEHYMLKEIFEQPTSIENAMRGRLDE